MLKQYFIYQHFLFAFNAIFHTVSDMTRGDWVKIENFSLKIIFDTILKNGKIISFEKFLEVLFLFKK